MRLGAEGEGRVKGELVVARDHHLVLVRQPGQPLVELAHLAEAAAPEGTGEDDGRRIN